MQIYDYLQNFHTGTDATVSGNKTTVQVEISRFQHGDWMTLETRRFQTTESARNWARQRIA